MNLKTILFDYIPGPLCMLQSAFLQWPAGWWPVHEYIPTYGGTQKIPSTKMRLGVKDAQTLPTLFLNKVQEDMHRDNRSFHFQ